MGQYWGSDFGSRSLEISRQLSQARSRSDRADRESILNTIQRHSDQEVAPRHSRGLPKDQTVGEDLRGQRALEDTRRGGGRRGGPRDCHHTYGTLSQALKLY